MIYKSKIYFANSLLSYLGFVLTVIATSYIFLDNLNQLIDGYFLLSSACFFMMFLMGLVFSNQIALGILTFLLPLTPTIGGQITAHTGIAISSQAIIGFDLVAGYFLSSLTKNFFYMVATAEHSVLRRLKMSWPVNLVILVLTSSVLLAIARNSWHSASPLSLVGLNFNLLEVRDIGWFDDFRPLTDWMSYVLAAGLIGLVSNSMESERERNRIIFRSTMLGLFCSVLMAFAQSITGIGLINPLVDSLGFSVMGFQPDLHAFAGYILLGVLGLWGYFSLCRLRVERLAILCISFLSCVVLVLSYSRATQFIAILILAIFLVVRLLKLPNQKTFARTFVIFVIAIGVLLTIYSYYGIPYALIPHRHSTVIKAISEIDWSNFSLINSAFSERPAIWLVASRAWISLPILGVGQGNFYQISPFFNFENFYILRNGENAHNYFLQTVAETGLVGCTAFAVAILMPFFLVKERRVLMPAAVALLSLFLGNIYAHSFLVRENLFLAAIFLGLMYSYVPQEKLALSPYKLFVSWRPKFPWRAMLSLSCFVIVGLGAREVYKSFYSFPFQYGTICFVNKPLTPDRWSSGLYEFPLPSGSHGAELSIKVERPNLQELPLGANFEIIDSENRVLASQKFEWRESGPQKLIISIPNGASIQDSGAKVSLRLSSCYTPRNLGESIDGRRLGVIVDSSIIH